MTGIEGPPAISPVSTIHWHPQKQACLIRKGAAALSLQWYKAEGNRRLSEHIRSAGGPEMLARSFAGEVIDNIGDYLSRPELNQLALAFLLELERRNQETPTPGDCVDLAAAVSRLQSQSSRERSGTKTLPRWNDRLVEVDPRSHNTLSTEVGARFIVRLPTELCHGYSWWNADVVGDAIGIVSRHKMDPMSTQGDRSTIETIFCLQGLKSGKARIKFSLHSSFPSPRIVEEVWLAANIIIQK